MPSRPDDDPTAIRDDVCRNCRQPIRGKPDPFADGTYWFHDATESVWCDVRAGSTGPRAEPRIR